MTTRITATPQDNGTTIKVDGRLCREAIGELRRVCQHQTGPVALDLTEVTSVDREAAAVLRELLNTVAELHAVSPYIKFLLEAGTESRRGEAADHV